VTTPPIDGLEYLERLTQLGMKFGLDTIRAMTRELGDPQQAYPVLLVAGTNGKGSVVAYVDAVLRASGLRVGRYTSPHLRCVNERIAVGEPISDVALEGALARVRDVANRLRESGQIAGHPTYFEALTAAAFDHFSAEKVDVAVVEVGLGGRLDATNVSQPLASAIVSIAHDHEALLGTSLSAIAKEKAGVLRPGRTTVLGPVSGDALHTIQETAAELRARLIPAAHGCSVQERDGGLHITTPQRRHAGLRGLPGRHQVDNLLVALRLLEEAEAGGIAVEWSRAGGAISQTTWPGRLQCVAGSPPLILDGAHNPAAARALARELRARGSQFVLLFGVMADKDVAGIAAELFPLARQIVISQPANERAAAVEDVVARTGATSAETSRDVGMGLRRAQQLASASEVVVVAGSLYLVGEVLRELEDQNRATGSLARNRCAREAPPHGS
jgi:dihydrofolate synthase/folylpolyglutamate synthase